MTLIAGAQEVSHELQVIIHRVCTVKNIINLSLDSGSMLQQVLHVCLSLQAWWGLVHELLERVGGVCQGKGHNLPCDNLAVGSDKRGQVLGPLCQLDLPELASFIQIAVAPTR